MTVDQDSPPDAGGGVESAPGPPAPSTPAPPAPRRPRKIFLVIGLAAAAALAVGLFTGFGTHHSGSDRPTAGSPAPSFTLPRLGGAGNVGTPGDGGGHGRPAVLLFFASWCGPCHQELPALAAAVRRQQAAGGPTARIAVLGVDTIDPTPAALAFVHSSGVTFPVGADTNAEVFDKYQLPGDPVTVYIDGDGTISHISYGPTSPAELARYERSLVAR